MNSTIIGLRVYGLPAMLLQSVNRTSSVRERSAVTLYIQYKVGMPAIQEIGHSYFGLQSNWHLFLDYDKTLLLMVDNPANAVMSDEVFVNSCSMYNLKYRCNLLLVNFVIWVCK